MRTRHLLGLGLVFGLALGAFALWPQDSTAQPPAATLWYRTGRSVVQPQGGRPWQQARPNQLSTVNGRTFKFEVTPILATVATMEDGRFASVMVGCNDRARVRRSMLIVGNRRGPDADVDAVVEIYCGPTAPTD